MKKLWKKSVAFVMAMSMVVSMAGCGKTDGKSSKKEETAEEKKEMVYEGTELTFDGVKGEIGNFQIQGDKIYFITNEWKEEKAGTSDEGTEADTGEQETTESETEEGASTEDVAEEETSEEDATEEGTSEEETAEEGAEETETEEMKESDASNEDIEYTNTVKLYTANKDGGAATEINMPELTSSDYVYNMTVLESGEILLMINSWDEKTEETTYKVIKMNETGEVLSDVNITKELALGKEEYINNTLVDGKGRIVAIMDSKVKVLDENFKLSSEIKTENNMYLMGATTMKDGTVICGGDGGEDGAYAQVIDIDGKKWGEKINLSLRYFSSSDALMKGNGDYDFYFKDDSGIYGYIVADKKEVKIMDYLASNLTTDSTYGIIPAEDGNLYGTVWDNNGKTSFVQYKKVDPSTISDKKTITMGALYIDDSIKNAAIAFNKSNKEYRIDFKDYSNEEDPETKMTADIAAGNIPDILCLSNVPVSQYISKGILEDLTPYFDKDPEINTSDFIPSVYEAIQTEGKLYFISPSFGVQTLVASAKDVGTEPGWTFTDLKKLLEEKGDGVRPFYSTNKSDMLYSFLAGGIDDYIDWQTGKCTFDSQDFKDMLEICNQYGENEEMEWSEDSPSMPSLVAEGKVLFSEGWMSLDEIQLYQAMYKGDVTFIGYPKEDKAGSYFNFDNQIGIYSKSEVKDGAWEFLRTFMTKEFQANRNNIWNNPTRQDAFDMFIKTRTATEKYTDEFGQEIEPYQSSWGYDDLEVEIKPSTDEQVAMFTALIDSTKKYNNYNYSLMEIIQEEAKRYFAGEKSLDETCKVIQNRMETYVNENR